MKGKSGAQRHMILQHYTRNCSFIVIRNTSSGTLYLIIFTIAASQSPLTLRSLFHVQYKHRATNQKWLFRDETNRSLTNPGLGICSSFIGQIKTKSSFDETKTITKSYNKIFKNIFLKKKLVSNIFQVMKKILVQKYFSLSKKKLNINAYG